MNQNDLPEPTAAAIMDRAGSIARRPVVPLRLGENKVGPIVSRNPFTAVEEANRVNADLASRLDELAKKMVGSEAPAFKPPEKDIEQNGLLPFSGEIARLMTERTRHMISVVDKIEEFLG
jgi:hypothetical protein